uniref:Beta-defensin n=1 Tax=Rhinolophus ferrumequinum TaxID=59479 RepID=A0A671F6F5_RHIFE
VKVLLLIINICNFLLICSTEKCWKHRGSCRNECVKNEKFYVFCLSGKLCCVKPKFQPNMSPKPIMARSPRAQ